MLLFFINRSCQQSHSVLSGTRPISAGKLRLAWNGFARLLFVPSEDLFQCPKCGAEPSIIICDGTTLGCNKLLLKSLPDDPVSTDGHIKGSSFVSRTFITDSTVRKLLQKYCTDCLSHNELSMLLGKLHRANKHSLATFIEWVHRNTEQASSVSCPEKYKKIMKDIAASGPACALFQGTTNEDLDYMKAVLQSNEPIFKTNYASVMNFIQRKFPIFVDFLTISRTEDSISNVSRDLLLDIIETGMQAFVAPGERVYSPADAEEMIEGTHFFPNLPKLHRYVFLIFICQSYQVTSLCDPSSKGAINWDAKQVNKRFG